MKDVSSTSEERFLLREMAHRIHNEFASAMAAVSIAAAGSDNPDVKAALGAVRERLYRYAQVHRALEAPADDCLMDAAEYLGELCQAIARAKLDDQGIEIMFGASALLLRSEQCWRLGMIVSELATNASRHAFHDRRGRIRIDLSRGGDLVECRVCDDGAGAANVRPGKGLGIVARLAEGLGGGIVQTFGPTGSLSVLTFPAAPQDAIAGVDLLARRTLSSHARA